MAVAADAGSLPWVDRIAESFPIHDFVAFHRHELPDLIEANGAHVGGDVRDAAPLGFRLPDGTAFTYLPTPTAFAVVAGDDCAWTLVGLDPATFSAFVNRLLTASGAVSTGRANLLRGTVEGWKRWEPALQAVWTGCEIFGPEAVGRLVDRRGAALDLRRSFSVDESEDEMRAFFDTAGYLHLRRVFTPGEVARLGDEVERARERTTPGDGFSWWSVDASGREVLTRINYLDRFSRILAEFAFDERLAHYARFAGPDLRVCDDRLDGPMVFVKNPHVVKGNGDLRWHTDDGSGGHPVMCPLVQAGIQLDPANADNGQVLVLAGSHRYAKHDLVWGEEGDLPVVAIDTEPGDLTLHYGDTMHTTPAPRSPTAGRRALYYKFAEPKTFGWVPAGCHYNDVLFRADATGRVAARATSWR